MSTLLSIHQSIPDVSHSLLDPETIKKNKPTQVRATRKVRRHEIRSYSEQVRNKEGLA